jgi:hypothetical protein
LRYNRSRVFTFLFFMPKLLGNSSGKNNKSCRIFHSESTKIGFAFLGFFYDFLRNLQIAAKHIYYLRLDFTGRPLELFPLLQLRPWFMKNTMERSRPLQCRPWPWPAARVAEIWRTPTAGSAGRGRGMAYRSLGLGFRARRVPDHSRWGGSAAARSVGRWSTRSGEWATRPGRYADRGC